ncbi:MAG: PLP-dependent aminotransferase family protein [Zavarzinella sp.]
MTTLSHVLNKQMSEKAKRTPDSPISFFMKKALENKDLISLAAGFVDSPSLPVEPLKDVMEELLADPLAAQVALQYGTTQGYRPLIDQLVQHLGKLDHLDQPEQHFQPHNVVITTGSQQLLYMLCELMVDPGDIVIVESPSYFVFHSVLVEHGVRVEQVPMDDEGLRVDALEDLCDELRERGELHRVKLLYCVDYFQNPTGLTLSKRRREELLAFLVRLRQHHHLFVLEDAAYRELVYEGENLPSLKSYDKDNQHVIYAGTFSKPCAPGFKTGYAVLPEGFAEPLLRIKGNHDFGSSHLAQNIIHRFLISGKYQAHVAHLRGIYREKRDALIEALEQHFGDVAGCRWTNPCGGMFNWLTLPENVPTSANSEFMDAAVAEGVIYIPGEFCYYSPDNSQPKHEIRLSFGAAQPNQIRAGIARLRKAYDRVTKKACESSPTTCSTGM